MMLQKDEMISISAAAISFLIFMGKPTLITLIILIIACAVMAGILHANDHRP